MQNPRAYSCKDCTGTKQVPDLAALAAKCTPSPRWWDPVSLPDVQADAVETLLKGGMCGRHASLMADLLRVKITTEGARRTLPALGDVRGR